MLLKSEIMYYTAKKLDQVAVWDYNDYSQGDQLGDYCRNLEEK